MILRSQTIQEIKTEKGVAMSLKEHTRSRVIKKGTAPKNAPAKAETSRKPPGANSSKKSQSN